MEQTSSFSALNLSEEMLRALEKKGYGWPTRVQAEAIPPLMAWRDVIAKAPTGTGKTFAFGIPMIEHIDPESTAVQGLILAPTRELAIQIGDELRSLLEFFENIRVAVVYGGQRDRDAAPPAQAEPADCGGHAGPVDGPLQAARAAAGRGADRHSGRGRPDAGHGLL